MGRVEMKHYINPSTNEIYAYESDGSQDSWIPDYYIPISDQDANDMRENIQREKWDALTYTQKRALEYPDFREYLDGIVKGDQAQIDKYISDCMAVKAKYPKLT
jgi:hypothetical protein